MSLQIPSTVIDAAYEVAVMEPERQDVEEMLLVAFDELGLKEEFDFTQIGPFAQKPRVRLVSAWQPRKGT